MVLILCIGIVLYAYNICRWGRTSGCSRRTKGGLSGWRTSSGEHRVLVMAAPQKPYKPFCGKFTIVNELFVSYSHIYVCDHKTNYLCMCLGIFFFLIFQLNFLYHYISVSLFNFCLKGLDNDMSYKSIRVLFSFFCLADTYHLVGNALRNRRVRKRKWWSQLERMNWGR